MDKIYIVSKLINIFKEDIYPCDEEIIAYITALGEVGTKEAIEELLKTYEKSNKSSKIKIATLLAISKCCD
ncbi:MULTISPECIES: hypothetical protein [Enterobacteriaceae]|uniref:hypothetical protein n=1 Tax=Enterobacteriaceae TaxID=543 RepID=UPI000C238095|nr:MULTISPECIES: hypothetical protein [Enterobacteriaceae]AVE78896.1 hypothetical protein AM355_17555 [Klebsiella oxytoca]HAU4285906.1 hypothetical protein [Citrobacter freundii]EEU9260341.1 hypothetical protein [Escherichia coli]EEY5018105.1 hypothetical protein [Escherichia coli]EFE7722998.1 hypothetical protein [Escherichia coli]